MQSMDTDVITNPETKEKQDDLVRLEANVEELPIFLASARRMTKAFTWARQGRDPATGRPVEQSILFEPSQTFGHPGPLERDLYCQVIAPWIMDHGFEKGGIIGPIRYQEACSALGWKRSGQNYKKIHQAVHSIGLLRIVFSRAIINGQTRRLEEHAIGLFERYGLQSEVDAGQTERVRKGEFYLKASEWLVRNFEANYLKPYNLTIHRALRTPLARFLYGYLDKRAWRRAGYMERVVEPLDDLRQRFGLTVRQTKHLVLEFQRAHTDLLAGWPILREAQIEKVAPGRYQAVYVFSPQTRLQLDGAPVAEPAGEGREVIEDDPLVRDLTFRGINAQRARHLVRAHDPERIRLHMDIHDQEIKQRSDIAKPGAWLYLRIRENWEPFPGYRSPAERHNETKRRQDQEGRQYAVQGEIEADRAAWFALSPEERAQKRTERWAEFQAMIKKPLNDLEREALYEKHLAQERQEESKIS